MRRPLVAGNWKMHGDRAGAIRLISELAAGLSVARGCDVMVCPPAVYLEVAVRTASGSGIAVGAQDAAPEDAGAHTGDISAAMLADVGCRAVIVGHSERRGDHGETSATVAGKFAAVLRHGLLPLLCVGETAAQRQQGRTEAVIEEQLAAVLELVGIEPFRQAIVAYEPVWAIGTGDTATPAQAQGVHAHIRAFLGSRDATVAAATRILYGGSVKPENAGELFAMDDVDGGLIGGASLKAGDFLAICAAAG